jgi:hypothetical protein
MPFTRLAFSAAALALLLVLPCASPAHAQGALVYATGGPAAVWNIGHRDRSWHAGGGVEVLNGPLGLGGEVGYLYFPEVTKTFDGGRGVASSPAAGALALSAKATFHFGSTTVDRRLRPFVTAGLSFLVDEEVMPILPLVSGGVDWWATRRVGLRLEAQSHWRSMLGVRVGVVLR